MAQIGPRYPKNVEATKPSNSTVQTGISRCRGSERGRTRLASAFCDSSTLKLDSSTELPPRAPEKERECVRDQGFRVQSAGSRVQGIKFRVQGSGFRVQGLGLVSGFQGFSCRVSRYRVGSGIRASAVPRPTTSGSGVQKLWCRVYGVWCMV